MQLTTLSHYIPLCAITSLQRLRKTILVKKSNKFNHKNNPEQPKRENKKKIVIKSLKIWCESVDQHNDVYSMLNKAYIDKHFSTLEITFIL